MSVPPPRTRRAGETTAGAPPDVPGAPAAETNGGPQTFGQYDQRILACLKLAPPLGMTAKDVVRGVAGKKADEAYGTVWSALNNFVKRGLIAKDGRYYRPIEAEQEDSHE